MTALDRNDNDVTGTEQVEASNWPVSAGVRGESGSWPTLYIQGIDKDDLYSGPQLIAVINDIYRNDAPKVLL